jgi:hypothetical protein
MTPSAASCTAPSNNIAAIMDGIDNLRTTRAVIAAVAALRKVAVLAFEIA